MRPFNRSNVRTLVNEKGRIKIGRFKWMECDLADVSPSGARVVLPPNTDLPKEFTMKVPKVKKPQHCLSRWRHGNVVGVEFYMS